MIYFRYMIKQVFGFFGVIFLVWVLSCFLLSCSPDSARSTTASTTTTTFAPVDLSIFTHFVTDEAGDTDHPGDPDDELPPGGVVYFDEIDVIRVSCATYEGRIYIYTQVATTFNTDLVTFEDGEVVGNRSFNVCVDLDNNQETGSVWGTDLHTAITIAEGFQNGIVSYYSLYATGEGTDSVNCQVNNGGVGYDYVVVSITAEALNAISVEVSSGDTFAFIAWAESESINYHHYAFDQFKAGATTRFESVMGGE